MKYTKNHILMASQRPFGFHHGRKVAIIPNGWSSQRFSCELL